MGLALELELAQSQLGRLRHRKPTSGLLVVVELRGARFIGHRVGARTAEEAVVIVDGRNDLDPVRQLAARQHDGIRP